MSIETSLTQAKAAKQKGQQDKLCVKESSNYFPKATDACYAVPSNHPTVLQPYSPVISEKWPANAIFSSDVESREARVDFANAIPVKTKAVCSASDWARCIFF